MARSKSIEARLRALEQMVAHQAVVTTDIRAARAAKGLSQEQVAVAAGISVAWFRQLERDPVRVSARVAERLYPVLGLNPSKEK